MATYPRHKKARKVRDFMIDKDIMKLFQEDEHENNILFRTIYPMQNGDKCQVAMSIDDTIYVGVQILIAQNVDPAKNDLLLRTLNDLALHVPTVKYVLTKDQNVIASMFFTQDEEQFDGGLVVSTLLNLLKVISEKQYSIIKETLTK